MTATILWFHEVFIVYYGAGHLLISIIFQEAHRADVATTDHAIYNKLITWSKLIQGDFSNTNIDFHASTSDNQVQIEMV